MYAVTVMCVLLFVFDVSMQRECEGYGNAGVWDGTGMVAVSMWMVHVVHVLCVAQMTC